MKKASNRRLVSLGRVSALTRAVTVGLRDEIGTQNLHYPF